MERREEEDGGGSKKKGKGRREEEGAGRGKGRRKTRGKYNIGNVTNGIRQKGEGKRPNGRKVDDVKRWTKEEGEDKEGEVKEENERK